MLDAGKLVYGQSFALYALAAHARATGDRRSLAAAAATFDVLQQAAADVARGGYYENLEGDWSPAPGGSAAGDRKSLDVHMHLLEAFTELALATGSPVHRRRLAEIRELILAHMVDPATGAGGNQYDLAFRPLPPVVIDRTWVAERPADRPEPPASATTSYGHNLELAWLLARADDVLGHGPAPDLPLIGAIADHALRWGYDHERGGVFREGPPDGPATDRDKEFWQNAEAMVGFLDAYRLLGDRRYLDAFLGTWRFSRRHLAHPILGEWRIRVGEDGRILVGDLGGPWKAAYHTGRAALECVRRLDGLLAA